MNCNFSSFKALAMLFEKLNCCFRDLGDIDDVDMDTLFYLVDEDKMRCHIINCLTALLVVQTDKLKRAYSTAYESVKRKVFNAAIISMINYDEFDSNETAIKTILSSFPDEKKMFDERSWLPMHFAIALNAKNEIISEDDVRILLSGDPLAMHRLSETKEDEEEDDDDDDKEKGILTGCTPAHLLCMQKHPKMSLVRYLSLRDPKAFVLRDQSGRCALHLVAQYSESLELLQYVLQIDCKMTKMTFKSEWNFNDRNETTPLGLFCRRPHFPTFDKIVLCLIAVDSTIEVVFDGMVNCLRAHYECLHQDVSPGSRGERSLSLIRTLLDSNPAITKYDNSLILHKVCSNLRGELGLSVLSLFLEENSSEVKSIFNGDLPIHGAARSSCVDVVKFLHKAWPESISMLDDDGGSLLHRAVIDDASDIADVKAKVQYICDECPALIHLKDNYGNTALHVALRMREDEYNLRYVDYECVKILCGADETVVRDKCTPADIDDDDSGQYPLHFLLYSLYISTEVSDEGDCFRLLLRLYPAAAGIKDDHSSSPYDVAVHKSLSTYFIRMLLSADPTIDPARRHDLNFEARRQGMFLAFRALSSDIEASIWAKIRHEDINLLERVISYL